MNERSCDHMIDTEAPFCYLGLHFPNSCKGCSRYLQDGEHWDDHREKVWQKFALGKKANGQDQN